MPIGYLNYIFRRKLLKKKKNFFVSENIVIYSVRKLKSREIHFKIRKFKTLLLLD